MTGAGLFVEEEVEIEVKQEVSETVVEMEVDSVAVESASDTSPPPPTMTSFSNPTSTPDITNQDEDDPILNTMPVFLNPVSNDTYHILQFPGRPKLRQLPEQVKPAIKLELNYLQIKQPLDITKFFNVNKTEDWGESIGEQTVEGVMDPTKGLFVCQVTDGKVVLTPVLSSVQMRSTFDYVDEVDKAAALANRKEVDPSTKPQQMQILQSAAKVNTQNLNAEGYNGALGEALRYIKRFDEEEWTGLSWKVGEEVTLPQPVDTLLKTDTTLDEYIDLITNEMAGL